MSKPPVPTLISPSPVPMLGAGLAGLVLGHLVTGLAVRHEGSAGGLFIALVFLVSGSVAVTLFLAHRHQQAHGRGAAAPTQAWLMALCAGVLAAVHFGL